MSKSKNVRAKYRAKRKAQRLANGKTKPGTGAPATPPNQA